MTGTLPDNLQALKPNLTAALRQWSPAAVANDGEKCIGQPERPASHAVKQGILG